MAPKLMRFDWGMKCEACERSKSSRRRDTERFVHHVSLCRCFVWRKRPEGPRGHVIWYTLSTPCHGPKFRPHHTCNQDAKWNVRSACCHHLLCETRIWPTCDMIEQLREFVLRGAEVDKVPKAPVLLIYMVNREKITEELMDWLVCITHF
jgi:hypothetical protein